MKSGPESLRPSEPSRWHSAVPSVEYKQFSQIPKSERQKLTADTAQEFMRTLSSVGGQEFTDVTAMYGELKSERLIVRRTDPDAVIGAIANHAPLEIAFAGDTPYNNAVEWAADMGPNGISNAYLEGNAQKNAVVAVFGFRPKGGQVEVAQLPHTEMQFGDMRREQVRSVSGTVDPEDIRFVSLRIPAESYPESGMTEDERDRLFDYQENLKGGRRTEPVFIHRGYLFSK